MLIVVEGPEGAGKSKWCRDFQDAWPYPSVLVHHTRGSSTITQVNQELTAFARLPTNWAVVFDRWLYSEYVYAPLVGRVNDMEMDLADAEASFGKAIDFRVLLLPPVSVLEERRQPDDASIDKQLESNLYAQLLADWPRDVSVEPVIRGMLTLIENDELANRALEAANTAKSEQWKLLRALGRPAEEVPS